MLPVVQHAAREIGGFDVLVLLQPTQPFRTDAQVKAALKLLEETGADSVVSVVEIPAHYSPDFAMIEEHGRMLLPRATRRQDCRKAYYRDGTVYAIRREAIEEGLLYGHDCRPLIIPLGESVNLDTMDDWDEAVRRSA